MDNQLLRYVRVKARNPNRVSIAKVPVVPNPEGPADPLICITYTVNNRETGDQESEKVYLSIAQVTNHRKELRDVVQAATDFLADAAALP